MENTTQKTPEEVIEKPIQTETEKTVLVGADTLVQPLLEGMPEITESAPENKETKTEPDLSGFDPERHKVDENGKPKLDKKGNFIPKNKGRPPKNPELNFSGEKPTFATPPGGNAKTDNNADNSAETSAHEKTVPVYDTYIAQADGYLRMSYAPIGMWFTADAVPEETEHEILKGSLANALRHSQCKELNPWLMFMIVACGIAGAKLKKPTVRERVGILWNRFKEWRANRAKAKINP